MRSYIEEVKDFYKFVSSNFTYYKKRKVKKRTKAVMPKSKVKTKMDEKATSKNRKRKAEVTPIRKVN